MTEPDPIAIGLAECNVLYPAFNARTPEDLRLIWRIFSRELAGHPPRAIQAAFQRHQATSARFPVLSDIAALLATVTCYRLDYGPDGYGALYAADHPYVVAQRRAGVAIADRAVGVPAVEAGGLAVAAVMAPALPAPADDPKPGPRTSRGGLRRIGA